MPDRPDRSDENAELALLLHEARGEEEILGRVVDHALKAVRGTSATVALYDGERRAYGVMLRPALVSEPGLEVLLDDGAERGSLSHEVLQGRFSVLVQDTRSDRRWPSWAATAARCGVRSMLTTRLYTSGRTLGLLQVHHHEAEQFGADDVEAVHALARHASVALDAAHDEANLWRAIDARKLVGQAQGIVMERFGLDRERAFALLRRHSQDRNVKLSAIARNLVETGRLPDDETRA